MLTFYRRSMAAFLVLLAATATIIYSGYAKSQLNTSLFPADDDGYLWAPAIEPRNPTGDTWLSIKSKAGTLDYEFMLDPEESFPYTHFSLYFIKPEQAHHMVDLTGYHSISFRVLCAPRNVLLFALFSYDDQVTDPLHQDTRRVSSTAFSCDNRWETVTLELKELITPDWWLDRYGLELSERGYRQDKTMGLAFINSLQSPVDVLSQVRIDELNLIGSRPGYLYASVGVSLALWALFLAWATRAYISVKTAVLKEKIKRDQPLIAYKKLSIEPQKDKDKSALLRHIATEYANSELTLDSTAATLGINRTKVNEILKEELGLTFTAYLKRLRLTEAARLLSENSGANISQVAYCVGYNNVSYFNKLFKEEYGCPPKTFQSLCRPKNPEEQPD